MTKCSKCEYWKWDRKTTDGHGTGIGLCKIHAPRFVASDQLAVVVRRPMESFWPETYGGDECGEGIPAIDNTTVQEYLALCEKADAAADAALAALAAMEGVTV